MIWTAGNNKLKSPAGLCSLSLLGLDFQEDIEDDDEGKTPDPDPVVIFISRHRLNFIGPSCEE